MILIGDPIIVGTVVDDAFITIAEFDFSPEGMERANVVNDRIFGGGFDDTFMAAIPETMSADEAEARLVMALVFRP